MFASLRRKGHGRPERARSWAWWATVVLLLLAPALGHSQTDRQPGERLDRLEQELNWIERLLDLPPSSRDDLKALSERVQTVVDDARRIGEAAAREADASQELLSTLGPRPEEDDAPLDTPEVRERRLELEQAISEQEGLKKRADLIVRRGGELFDRIAAASNRLAAQHLLTRHLDLLDAGLWRQAAAQADELADRFEPAVVLAAARWPTRLVQAGIIAAGAIAIFGICGFLARSYRRRWLESFHRRPPRFLSAIFRILSGGALPALAVLTAALVLVNLGKTSTVLSALVWSAAFAAAGLILAVVVAHTVFKPRDPRARLVQVGSAEARRILVVLVLLIVLAAVSLVLNELVRAGALGRELYQVLQLFIRTGVAALIVVFWLRAMRMRRAEDASLPPLPLGRSVYRPLFNVVQALLPTLLVLDPLIMAFGFWPLGDWLFFGALASTSLLIALWLVHNATREVLALTLYRTRRPVQSGRRQRRVRPQTLSFWGVGSANAILLGLVLLGLLIIWDVPALQVGAWMNRLFVAELTFGSVTVSLIDGVVALIVFGTVLVATRVAQRVVERRILARTRLDVGARHIVWSAISYLGIALALVLGFAALGLDLSRVILIVGALSVGIGFALQPIVSNFVSGLILLAERPLKVGDWVVVGEHEGMVKRVGVRATEIETLLGASALIPNADLITEHVTNWTLGNPAACIEIRVETAPDVDEELVRDLLLQVAAEHPRVLTYPAPLVLLSGLSGAALTFDLYAYASRAPDRYTVGSDLRYGIKAALRRAGIRLAVPLHQITMSRTEAEPQVADQRARLIGE